MKTNEKDNLFKNVVGSVSITKHDKSKGISEIVFEEEQNIIVNSGGRTLLYGLLPEEHMDDLNQEDFTLDKIKIGNEVGDGSDQAPEKPSPESDGSEQNVLFERKLEFFRKEDLGIGFVVSLDNEEIFNELEIKDNREGIGLTSLTLWTQDNRLFAYKRFPVIFITVNIDIAIDWKITWISQN